MRVLITIDCPGIICEKLITQLIDKQYKVILFANNISYVSIPDSVEIIKSLEKDSLENLEAIISLTNENIFSSHFNMNVDLIKSLMYLVDQLETPPNTVIIESSVSIYNPEGYLKKYYNLLEDNYWELKKRVDNGKIRFVSIRNGVVFDNQSYLYKLLIKVGRIGDGKQYLSWIHIEDLVRVYIFSLENNLVEGPIDAVTSTPITNKELFKTFSHIFKKVYIFSIPVFLIKWILKDKSEYFIISNKITPEKIIKIGFHFSYPKIVDALKSLKF